MEQVAKHAAVEGAVYPTTPAADTEQRKDTGVQAPAGPKDTEPEEQPGTPAAPAAGLSATKAAPANVTDSGSNHSACQETCRAWSSATYSMAVDDKYQRLAVMIGAAAAGNVDMLRVGGFCGAV